MNTTSYMDKQIMDLSQGSSSPQTKDFIDLMTHNNLHAYNHQHHHNHNHGGDEEEEEEEDEDEGDQSHAHGATVNGGISNKDEILASYDFQPIRPLAGAVASSSQSAGFDLAGSARAWNSGESKPKTASPIRVTI